MRYAQYVNRRRKASGHLWQGRFYSTILDEPHVYAAVKYVENNPVRAGVVITAEEYSWSSAKVHVQGNSDGILSLNCYLLSEIKNWKRYLREEGDENLIQNVRKNSMTGRPCGEESFIKKLERRFGRRLKALAHGRPRKTK
jgi:putative transposase